ncbi:uncharacterized protein HMPREF1120_04029 [Exophiala dermatitidis NIH/UT8656]|uniref:Uncharacterized protein n=1 Tax=Exophiala dermatitidis (strain ATCC 34100 / CBS 525.76 / NIH/UT8656) TaxID=858893 RepID=H6BVP4_EXODN|nr:uncharacterized protein HMPREF1120_04029 [Exophiala dermatitidis NIH/UT8656]EHY55920.1 hypothetical protein HMPREF1120_04029 [Exophiala dermatitidis NIH/UT8656]
MKTRTSKTSIGLGLPLMPYHNSGKQALERKDRCPVREDLLWRILAEEYENEGNPSLLCPCPLLAGPDVSHNCSLLFFLASRHTGQELLVVCRMSHRNSVPLADTAHFGQTSRLLAQLVHAGHASVDSSSAYHAIRVVAIEP